MSFKLHSKISLVLITSLICGFSFSQDINMITKSLQSDWDLCNYRTNKHFCESNVRRPDCNYHIRFIKNQFILFKESREIDAGNFEIEHHYDDVFFINFYSSSNDEILKLLSTDTIKLFNKKEEGFMLLIELTGKLFILKKQQHNLDN
ncbi:hypothetical protein [uncultured Aquimarina sp.]|uniref:hypothetical protein n=1 Tax=uncultured Aquimarina sp. TaxID=575652 RepID=UPI002639379A|nr:hypothetical protein [uncultured Aquimarina sp.]